MEDKIPEKVRELLKKVVNGDIEKYVITVHDPNKKGEGFIGQMFFISLKEKNNGKQLHLAVKQAFPGTKVRESFPIRAAFENEINFYTKLWPKFLKFQEAIPSNNRFFHLAKCWDATSEEDYERLALENLKYDGFVLHNKEKPLTKDQFEFIFKLYGRFHAISFAYKALQPEEFSENIGNVIDVWKKFTEKEDFCTIIKVVYERGSQCLHQGVDDVIIEKYKKYLAHGIDIFRESLDSGKNPIITHGDSWSNNMMFKYDDNGKLIDMRFLDFQLVRLASPVCDLSYCLYSGGNKEIFDQLDYLLQVYHDSLSQSLRAYGCDPDELYPLEELKSDWKVYCQMGMMLGLMLWRIKLTGEDDITDFTDTSDDGATRDRLLRAKFDRETFMERAREIISHLYENNYLL